MSKNISDLHDQSQSPGPGPGRDSDIFILFHIVGISLNLSLCPGQYHPMWLWHYNIEANILQIQVKL